MTLSEKNKQSTLLKVNLSDNYDELRDGYSQDKIKVGNNTIPNPTQNQRLLLNVGALSPNLFLDFSQHVRFLIYSTMNLSKTLKMP
jgi:hypothetical protein